jgi:hypothetical protein
MFILADRFGFMRPFIWYLNLNFKRFPGLYNYLLMILSLLFIQHWNSTITSVPRFIDPMYFQVASGTCFQDL